MYTKITVLSLKKIKIAKYFTKLTEGGLELGCYVKRWSCHDRLYDDILRHACMGRACKVMGVRGATILAWNLLEFICISLIAGFFAIIGRKIFVF